MLPKVSLPSLRSLFSKQEYWRPCEIGGQYALFGHHCPVAFCYLNFAAVFCLHSVSQFVNQPIGRTNFVYDLSFCWRFAIFFLKNTETYSLLIPDMDTYSQNFQFSANQFFGCQYSNFVNLCLKLGVETMEAIILIIFGGRHCKTAIGLVLVHI